MQRVLLEHAEVLLCSLAARSARIILVLLALLLPLHAAGRGLPPAGAPVEHRLHVLFTADLSGRFAWPGCGQRERGRADLSHLVAAVQAKRRALYRAGEDAPLMLAAGNTIRPDLLGTHIFGEGRAWASSAILLLHRLGLQAAALGPYDLSAHADSLRLYMGLMHQTRIPLLAANVTCRDPSDFRCQLLGGEGREYVVLTHEGLRIGVLSVLREDLLSRIPKLSAGSLVPSDPLPVARTLIRKLRREERADIVLLLANLNLEARTPDPVLSFVRDLGHDSPDLVIADMMFDQRSQDFISRIHSKLGPLIVGTDRFGQHLGEAILRYRREGGRVVITGVRARVEPVASVTPDPASVPHVQDMLAELCRTLDQRLGRARVRQPMSRDDFMTYVMEIMRNRLHAEIALLNESSTSDTPFPLLGPLTRESVLRALRSDNHLGTFRVSGAELQRLLTPYLTGQRWGLRVLGVRIEGDTWYVNNRPLLTSLHYRVATSAFVARGGDELISLTAERFLESGFTLPRVVTDFFEEDKQATLDGDPSLDVQHDFPDPWQKWMLYWGTDVGASVSNIAVSNGPEGNRYNQPLLKRDNVAALKLDATVSLGASNRNHTFEGDIALQFGETWTRTAAERAAGEAATTAETQDKIQGNFVYQFNRLRNLKGPGHWYTPVPYGEATLISEFTPSGCTPYASCSAESAESDESDESDEGQDATTKYRYLYLGSTAGIGFSLHPSLFVKAGFSVSGELLTPAAALAPGDEREARTGLYFGYKLRRIKLNSSVRHPLQLESRLDCYLTDFIDTFRREVTLESKLYYSLTSLFHLSASHSLYVFDTSTAPLSMANDISLGLELVLDYRLQVF